jgi:hypothetical protein
MNVYGKTCLKPFAVQTANKDNKDNGTQGSQDTSASPTYDPAIVSATDKVLYIVVQTTKNSPVNDVNFILNSFNVCLKTGTTNFAFSNAGVLSAHIYNRFFTPDTLTGFDKYQKQAAHIEVLDA